MADIHPFAGLRYDPSAISNLSDVITPPYDVINDDQRDAYYERHPNNVIRLVLTRPETGDREDGDRHVRAAGFFNQWRENGVLTQDRDPAIYLTTTEFNINGTVHTRYGIVCLVKLEPFDRGIILPHERTFSRVRSERLALLKATHANFCPIFSIFPDPGNEVDQVTYPLAQRLPEMAFTDDDRTIHRLWRITDNDVILRLQDILKDRLLFIADGHHRYETALNYRRWVAERERDFGPSHPANFVMMYLCSIENPGLVVLPAHRLLASISESDRRSFFQKAADVFHTTAYPFSDASRQEVQRRFLADLEAGGDANTFGVVTHAEPCFHLMRPRSGIMEARYGGEMPPELLHLDVTVITRLAFMDLLGFDRQRLDDEKRIGYSSIADTAIESVLAGRYDMGFILNPTRIDQVQAVSRKGLIMPRKSTYFYPKAITGQVLYAIE